MRISFGFIVACVASLACGFACTSFGAPPTEPTSSDGGGPPVEPPRDDAAAEASTVPLFPLDPGIVACDPDSSDVNERECETSKNEMCCYRDQEKRDCQLSCVGGAAIVRCDETADCPNGELCCGGLGLRTECGGACAGPQICKTDAECGGGRCEPYDCLGRKIGACSNSTVKPTAPCVRL